MNITQADFNFIQIRLTLAVISFTLLVYDYTLTFSKEVERFWPKRLKNLFSLRGRLQLPDNHDADQVAIPPELDRCRSGFTWASLLFFFNRYLTILGYIPVMLGHFWRRTDIYIKETLLVMALQINAACMMTMRIYALYERQKWVAALYIVVASVTIGLAVWAITNSRRSNDSPPVKIPYGCGLTMGSQEARYLAVPWLGQLIFDVLIFGMTFYKSLTLPRGGGIGLLSMLIRDGTMYFGAMVVTNVGNIMSLWFGGPLCRGSGTVFMNTMSSILVSRLLLNMRDPKLHLHGAGTWGGYHQETTINNFGFNHGGGTRSTWYGTRGLMSPVGDGGPRTFTDLSSISSPEIMETRNP